MSRATSYNWEIQLSADPNDWIFPASLGEFGEGEEGRIKVADGDRAYQIRDQIYDIGEIEVVIYIKDDKREYNLMQEWCYAGNARDIWIVARGAGRDIESGGDGREETMRFLLRNTECAMGKKSAFDRNAKAFDSKTYMLIPEFVEDVSE